MFDLPLNVSYHYILVIRLACFTYPLIRSHYAIAPNRMCDTTPDNMCDATLIMCVTPPLIMCVTPPLIMCEKNPTYLTKSCSYENLQFLTPGEKWGSYGCLYI